ncbi:ABC transporter substrate-binding protein [Williamsia sp. CHRR-6]|uniref:ABC transporter substrate-binding protein n=1 Tax=Williamsia sp. CHRR-6 TaxID=2835871 RepID=UPI001BDADB82|nr:ABC transporter substrate-binding protein [Williamsia sp. CHRR-6]MBT0565612.1 ABC transporter substrate-binding protein [Williamsia sp. CHRR-6]
MATYIAMYAMYESLVAVRQGRTELLLAEEITPNSDARVWTIRLRDSIRFSDGSPVTATDALASLRHFAASPVLGSFFTDVDLAASRAVDPTRLELTLTRPRADLIESVLTQASLVMKDGDPTATIGSGPFRLAGGTAAEGWSLDRVDGARLRAQIPGLDVRAINTPDTRANALSGNQVDYAYDLSPTSARTLSSRRDLAIGSSGPASSKALAVILNTRVAPFDNPSVRLAAKLTVDREALVKNVFQGYGTVGNDLLGPGLPTYPTGLPARTRDVSKARALFAAAGVRKIEFTVAEVSAGLTAAAELMVTQFAQAGVALTIVTADPAGFYADTKALARLPMFTTYYLNRTTSSALPFMTGSAGFFNLSGFGDADYDSRLTRMAQEVDPATRQRLIDETAQIAAEQGGDLIWGFQEIIDGRVRALGEVSVGQSAPMFGSAAFS